MWFTGAELEKIRLEAGRHGMAPAAWLAKTGTDAAEHGGRALAVDVADAVADMEAATAAARRIGSLPDVDDQAVGAAVARAVRRMEAATLRAARELLR